MANMPPLLPDPCAFIQQGLIATTASSSSCYERLLSTLYPDCLISPLPHAQQGGCSYTFFLTTTNATRGEEREKVVQFRDLKHLIPGKVVEDVERVFGESGLVPRVERMEEVEVGVESLDGERRGGGMEMMKMKMKMKKMQIVEMSLLKGVCVQDVLGQARRTGGLLEKKKEEWEARMERLLCDVADFFAVACRAGVREEERKRLANGLIGSSIAARLEILATDLSSAQLRRIAEDAWKRFVSGGLSGLPIVLNHGDLLPRNLLVDPETWKLTGVLDWAESEDLPFGLTLYGVEHLLGFVEGDGGSGKGKVIFVYYREADRLREVFWRRLRSQISELAQPEMWEGMLLARRVGMLLWHGIAWDDGKRNRAVSVEHDAEDLAFLEAFLESDLGPVQAKL